jgi:hypothetical protein
MKIKVTLTAWLALCLSLSLNLHSLRAESCSVDDWCYQNPMRRGII